MFGTEKVSALALDYFNYMSELSVYLHITKYSGAPLFVPYDYSSTNMKYK